MAFCLQLLAQRIFALALGCEDVAAAGSVKQVAKAGLPSLTFRVLIWVLIA
jgi:hypothetical protein